MSYGAATGGLRPGAPARIYIGGTETCPAFYTATNKKLHQRNHFSLWLLMMGIPESGGVETSQSQQPTMFKSFSALAVVTLLGAAVIALPAPKVEASEAAALAKGDRLQVPAPSLTCATQVWPDIAASCLWTAGEGAKILEARLVTARR
jgi:hypothetical protein